MSITVELPGDAEEYILAKARSTGVDITEYATTLLRKAVVREKYDAVFTPVQKGFEESGCSEQELDALVEEAREEIWRERRGDANHS